MATRKPKGASRRRSVLHAVPPPQGAGASAELLRRAREVDLLVLDVDGVLTDGGLYYGPQGEALKRFDVKDGHGIVLCRHAGVRCAILSARYSEAVASRAAELKISPVVMGRRDKLQALEELLAQAQVPMERAGYVADDLNDLGPFSRVVFAACPADAHPIIQAKAHYVASRPGGRGAVREIAELILKARGSWDEVLRGIAAPEPASR